MAKMASRQMHGKNECLILNCSNSEGKFVIIENKKRKDESTSTIGQNL